MKRERVCRSTLPCPLFPPNRALPGDRNTIVDPRRCHAGCTQRERTFDLSRVSPHLNHCTVASFIRLPRTVHPRGQRTPMLSLLRERCSPTANPFRPNLKMYSYFVSSAVQYLASVIASHILWLNYYIWEWYFFLQKVLVTFLKKKRIYATYIYFIFSTMKTILHPSIFLKDIYILRIKDEFCPLKICYFQCHFWQSLLKPF